MGWGRGRTWCQNPVLGHSRGVQSVAPGHSAVGHGWRGREQTPDERVGSRQPQTSDHCRLQLQDAQTQNVRSARWFPGPEFSIPRAQRGPSSAPILTTLRTGSQRVSPGPGSSPARANGAPRVGQGPPDVP